MKLTDTYNRVHDYLRISITNNCNFRCSYCMPEEKYAVPASAQLMQVNEIYEIAKIFVSLGVTKIRLTGGEPLVRKDASEIMNKLALLPVSLTLSTNGARLKEFLPIIKNSRIQSVNISLDTLDNDKFLLITKRNKYEKVIQNIRLVSASGINCKVNVVVMKGINDNEINDFVRLTRDLPVQVRFIEFMPFAGNFWDAGKMFGLTQILDTINTEFDFIKIKDEPHGTTKQFIVPGHVGTFAVISTITSPFCGDCNRMRLTADGKMKNCLFSREETDLLSPFRRGENIVPLIEQCVLQKAAERGGQFLLFANGMDTTGMKNRSMIAIGG